MNTKTQEALKMAIVAMDTWKDIDVLKARKMCKEALEQPTQEPVGYISTVPVVTPQAIRADRNDVFNIPVYTRPAPAQEPFGYFTALPFGWTDCGKDDEGAIALYEHPAPAWQELSDDKIREIANSHLEYDMDLSRMNDFARAIEQTLKEKNHG